MTKPPATRSEPTDLAALRRAHVAVVGGALPHRDVAWPVIEQISASLARLGYRNDIVDAEIDDVVPRLVGFDVAYVAHFGIRGDDGTTQATLAMLGIPYTGSGSKATAIAQDKVLSKCIFRAHGIPTPDWVAVDDSDDYAQVASHALATLGAPLVVKPVLGGGSYGMTLAETTEDIVAGLHAALEYGPAFLEVFVAGPTVTSGVLGVEPDEIVLDPHEVVFVDDRPFLDPVSLFKHGTSDTIHPPRISKDAVKTVMDLAAYAHRALGARGLSRSDFKVDANGKPWLLELNTMPAMSEVSDLPIAAARAGLSFDDLVETILSTALGREWWRP